MTDSLTGYRRSGGLQSMHPRTLCQRHALCSSRRSIGYVLNPTTAARRRPATGESEWGKHERRVRGGGRPCPPARSAERAQRLRQALNGTKVSTAFPGPPALINIACGAAVRVHRTCRLVLRLRRRRSSSQPLRARSPTSNARFAIVRLLPTRPRAELASRPWELPMVTRNGPCRPPPTRTLGPDHSLSPFPRSICRIVGCYIMRCIRTPISLPSPPHRLTRPDSSEPPIDYIDSTPSLPRRILLLSTYPK